ncbi:50S ribosomal protein L6 [Acidiluteibacter ferrifornacis]|jgi:large subunit ribosomal protein L6|uniref:Large ribosomal subunit protein uL6 n=1 Tax=Acidiluteibacter ferrifornacis TaxID=2692424 RepID=A0A6N9NJ00_9FLAO|nr:50S ribosomal protein L6 [Acidiluteibacter ferrifornacis]MBR9832234.1 50S ribosomal protein L6 [bacterium]NBG65834.1 50S ribosomal protein L6 [Acidiluteibacter ferrifornacis]
MSRIGKAPVKIAKGVEVTVSDKNLVTVKGPKGVLTQQVDTAITVEVKEGHVELIRQTEQKPHKAMHGLYRSLINNMIVGVSEGYKTVQELVGVGYRAANTGQRLELSLGFSHNIVFEIPEEVSVTTASERGQNPTVTLESYDKQLIGQVAAKIRSLRKPEPYKGKGIKFKGEQLRRKAGKSASK